MEDFIGGAEEFVQKIDEIWWNEKYRQLQTLQDGIGYDLLELLRANMRNQLKPSISSRNNSDSVFELKRYTSPRDGAKYEIRCSSKHYRKVKNLGVQLHMECREFVFHLSDEPTGTTLPKSHNPSYYYSHSNNLKPVIKNLYKIPTNITTYAYRIGEYRTMWYKDDEKKRAHIFEFAHRGEIGKKLCYRKG